MWRATVALPLWRATVAFKLCEEPVKRLLEHEFYGLALHMWRREPNQEPAGHTLLLSFKGKNHDSQSGKSTSWNH
jgi:hypothetical protein